jgi:hypothetical protein
MSARARPAAAPDRVEAYDRLVAAVPEVERKGASLPYTSLNGNMFSYLDGAGSMALRLSAEDRAAFIERHSTRLHVAHGVVQKEYVTVPDELLDDPEQLRPWFLASLGYARGLKPKPTRR